jgi:hypothetical protein
MDYDVLIVFGTMFFSLVAVLVYASWYQKFKHKAKKGSDSSNSMRASELEELIRNAVTEATRSLEGRMAGLEARVQALQPGDDAHARLPGRRGEPLLDANEPEDVPVGRREQT